MEKTKLKETLVTIVLSIAFIFQILLLIGRLTSCAQQQDKEAIAIPETQKDTYVYDQGDILDDNLESKVNRILVELEKVSSIEFVVVTVRGLNGETIEDYANILANSLGIGKKGQDNGILLLISKSDKRVRLEIGDGLQETLTDGKSGRILDDFFVPSRNEGDYDTAVEQTVSATINFLATKYNFAVDGVDDTAVLEDGNENDYGRILLLAILILIAIAIYVFAEKDRHSSGGGFFGSDGGGSSGGGFGGGGFSGGGASR